MRHLEGVCISGGGEWRPAQDKDVKTRVLSDRERSLTGTREPGDTSCMPSGEVPHSEPAVLSEPTSSLPSAPALLVLSCFLSPSWVRSLSPSRGISQGCNHGQLGCVLICRLDWERVHFQTHSCCLSIYFPWLWGCRRRASVSCWLLVALSS